jgi:hypothetical protein
MSTILQKVCDLRLDPAYLIKDCQFCETGFARSIRETGISPDALLATELFFLTGSRLGYASIQEHLDRKIIQIIIGTHFLLLD